MGVVKIDLLAPDAEVSQLASDPSQTGLTYLHSI